MASVVCSSFKHFACWGEERWLGTVVRGPPNPLRGRGRGEGERCVCCSTLVKHVRWHVWETMVKIFCTTPKGGGLFKSRTPTGCENFLGIWRGGRGRWVGQSAAGVHGGERGGGGNPTYITQNNPHDTLIVFNVHNWGKKCFRKNLLFSSGCYQPRSDPEVRSGSMCCCAFHPFLNSPQNSKYFEDRHIG